MHTVKVEGIQIIVDDTLYTRDTLAKKLGLHVDTIRNKQRYRNDEYLIEYIQDALWRIDNDVPTLKKIYKRGKCRCSLDMVVELAGLGPNYAAKKLSKWCKYELDTDELFDPCSRISFKSDPMMLADLQPRRDIKDLPDIGSWERENYVEPKDGVIVEKKEINFVPFDQY